MQPATPATDPLDAAFPTLDDGQVSRLLPFGVTGRTKAGDIIFEQGDSAHGVFVVLEGSIEIINVSNGDGAVIRVLGRGSFTGEVNQLSGRRSLVRCRARQDSRLLEIDRASLQRVMQTDAALGRNFPAARSCCAACT